VSSTQDFAPIHNEFIPWTPWQTAPNRAKVALVSLGGVYLQHGLHQAFAADDAEGDPSFREFPSVVAADDLELAPVTYDQSFARADLNVVFPLNRLHELAEFGYIGSVAPFVYSFLGQVRDPARLLANYAPSVAYRIKRMGADVALIVATGAVEHQAAALVARAIELAGTPTIVFGTDQAVLATVGTPRSVVVAHPPGAPLGNPGNAGKHQHLLREVLDAAWEFEGPGLVAELAHSWSGRLA